MITSSSREIKLIGIYLTEGIKSNGNKWADGTQIKISHDVIKQDQGVE